MFPDDAARIYRRFHAMVIGRAARLLGCAVAAEDVVQETFLKAFAWMDAGGRADDTAAFLYKTATNLALNVLRDRRRRRDILARTAWDEPGPEPLEHRLALRRVLGEVAPDEAQVAAYYYVDGMGQDEIAGLLGLHPRAVSRRLDSFRRRARRILEEDETNAS